MVTEIIPIVFKKLAFALVPRNDIHVDLFGVHRGVLVHILTHELSNREISKTYLKQNSQSNSRWNVYVASESWIKKFELSLL